MLPCQTTCPHYREGCHKACDKWAEFLRSQQELLHKKKDYLKFHNEACTAVIRSCREASLFRHRY